MNTVRALVDDEGDDQAPVTPLTAEQARQLRDAQPQLSPWWVVGAQGVVGLVSALVAAGVTAQAQVGWSLLYGALAVALPAALYARALARMASRRRYGAGFFVWELVKVGLTVALLAAAPRLVPGLDWLALLAGVVLATKMYWVALAFTRRPRRNGN